MNMMEVGMKRPGHMLESLCRHLQVFKSHFVGEGGHVQNRGLLCYPMYEVNEMGRINLTLGVPSYVLNLNGLAQRILESKDPVPKQFWLVQAAPLILRYWHRRNMMEDHRDHPVHLLK